MIKPCIAIFAHNAWWNLGRLRNSIKAFSKEMPYFVHIDKKINCTDGFIKSIGEEHFIHDRTEITWAKTNCLAYLRVMKQLHDKGFTHVFILSGRDVILRDISTFPIQEHTSYIRVYPDNPNKHEGWACWCVEEIDKIFDIFNKKHSSEISYEEHLFEIYKELNLPLIYSENLMYANWDKHPNSPDPIHPASINYILSQGFWWARKASLSNLAIVDYIKFGARK